MKIKINLLFASCLMLLMACGKDDTSPRLVPGVAPVLTVPGTVFTLLEAQQNEVIGTFTWTAADFGYPAGITYTLEYAAEGTNFAKPITLGTTTGFTIDGITQRTFNNSLLANEFPGGVTSGIEFRVKASVGDEATPIYSSVVAANVVPFETFVVLPKLQVPGSYQNWDVANNNTVIFSYNSDNVFDGYAYFNEAGTMYKYTLGNSWDLNWGDSGANGSLDEGGDNIIAGNPGVYKLHADINALTHTFELTTWGVIGDATAGGWDTDTDMSFDEANGVLTVTLDLIAGKLKFRANDGWTINLGDTDANGSLEQDGTDIIIPEDGNYTVTLKITGVQVYTYTITKN